MRVLTDQERAELSASKQMSPLAHLQWLAVALEFARMCERARPNGPVRSGRARPIRTSSGRAKKRDVNLKNKKR